MLSRHFLFLADRFLAGRSLADQDPCLNLIELKALTLIGLFFRVPQVPKKTQGPQRSRRRIRRVKVDPHLFYLSLHCLHHRFASFRVPVPFIPPAFYVPSPFPTAGPLQNLVMCFFNSTNRPGRRKCV